MAAKYIFVTGGVVSGLGKGITAASLGRLLIDRGLQVTVMKLDPYLNIDPGTMNPIQHGEVFVTDDGAETDLDLGHYERFMDVSLTKNSSCTSGSVYYNVLSNERKGVYGGQTVQIIPHITNEIKRRIALNETEGIDVVLVEIGGTVGDIESQPFLEAIRQFAQERAGDCMFVHVTLVPYLGASMELKTKPTQHSVKELLGIGIRPDIIVLRTEHEISQDIKDKIALFCNVPSENVIENRDMPTLYQIPMELEKEGIANIVVKKLKLNCKAPDHTDWLKMMERNASLKKDVNIALVGKYVELHDSYLSVNEALILDETALPHLKQNGDVDQALAEAIESLSLDEMESIPLEQLRDDEVRRHRVDLLAQKDDAVVKQAGVDVVAALAASGRRH